MTTRPARLCAEPIRLYPGGLRDRSRWQIDGGARAAVDETIGQLRHRTYNDVLYVTGWRDPDADNEPPFDPTPTERSNLPSRPSGGLRHSAHRGRILSVR